MKRPPTLVLLAMLLGIFFPAGASAQDDYSLFRERAGNASLLYRGHKAFEYVLLYNGTYYWSSPVFQPGEAVYNDKLYSGISLNIDAARQDLVLRMGDGGTLKVVEREHVRECTFGGRRYLNLQYLYGDEAPSGYWEVLYDGRAKIVRRVLKRLEQDLDGSKRALTHFEGDYRYDVYQTFTYSEDFCYVKENGQIVPVSRRRDILRQIDKPLRRDVRRHLRHQENTNLLSFDRYCTEVVKYLESR